MNRNPLRTLALITLALALIILIAFLTACDPSTYHPATPAPAPTATMMPSPAHPTHTFADECYDPATINDPADNFPPCDESTDRPSFAPDANIDILALCATNGSPCEAWMKLDFDEPISTYGTIGKTLNGGVIRKHASELDDDGFELWGMIGHFHGAVS